MIIDFNGGAGKEGPAGADGKSAYQIAVDNGYTGTEQEWLVSLKGEKVKLQKKDYSITENGTTAIAPDPEFDGIFTGDINVNVQPALQEKTVEIKANAAYTYTPDEGFYGLSKLNVNANIESTGSALNVAGTGWENGEATFPVSLARAGTLEDDLNYTRQKFAEWDPSETDLSRKYEGDKSLIYAPKIDTSNVTIMGGEYYGPFQNCSSLTSVPQFNTSNVTNMRYMFDECSSLTSVPQFDTSNVTDMYYMFHNCNSLSSVSQFDTRNVTNMKRMFWGCSTLASVPQFNTSKVTNMSSMLEGCHNLKSVPQFDTSNVTDMSSMLSYCDNLISVPQLDTSKVTNMSSIFSASIKIANLGGFKELKVSLKLDEGWRHYPLTKQSLLNVINNLGQADPNYDGGKPTLTLGQTNLNKLTAEEIAVGTAKGWQIVA